MFTETVAITIESTMITLPVRLVGVDPVSGGLPVTVMGYSESALQQVGVSEYALLLLILLFGALSVGLLMLLFLRFRIG